MGCTNVPTVTQRVNEIVAGDDNPHYKCVANNLNPDLLYKKLIKGGLYSDTYVDVPQALLDTLKEYDKRIRDSVKDNKSIVGEDEYYQSYEYKQIKKLLIYGRARRSTVDSLCVKHGITTVYAEAIPPPGKLGWSPCSTSCVGCGTYFHKHFQEGLCLLCYLLEPAGLTREDLLDA